MNNAEKFQEVFGYYATEMWAKTESEFLDWINAEYNEQNTTKSKLDLISRQAAINAIIAEGRNVDSRYLESERIVHESDAIEVLSMLPFAELIRGEWHKAYVDQLCLIATYTCSECGGMELSEFKYCPNCGAYMRGKYNE